MKIFKLIFPLILTLFSISSFAQKMVIEQGDYANQKIEMADVMRSEGKIYVLVAIIVAIFIGIVFYLIKTEQKLKKLEKEIKIQS